MSCELVFQIYLLLVRLVSFFAIIPLPKVHIVLRTDYPEPLMVQQFHSFATNELSKRMGSLDGLIDVSLVRLVSPR